MTQVEYIKSDPLGFHIFFVYLSQVFVQFLFCCRDMQYSDVSISMFLAAVGKFIDWKHWTLKKIENGKN